MRAFPIRDDEDLTRALEMIDELWSAPPESDDALLLEVMSVLVEVYEAEHHAVSPGDPVELIRFKLQELGWSGRELARRLGWGSGRVSEILNHRRPLTLNMVRQLSTVLGLRPGLLVQSGESEQDFFWARIPVGLTRSARQRCEDLGMSVEDWIAALVRRDLEAAPELLTYSGGTSAFGSAAPDLTVITTEPGQAA